MSVVIRQAEMSDLEGIHQIFSGLSVIRWNMRLPYPSLEYWRRRIALQEGTSKLVAIMTGHLMGYTEISTYSNPRMRHIGHIDIMAVRDDAQGKGIGSALMAACLDLADNYLQVTRMELDVWTDNEAALRLYQKFGFEIEGTHIRSGFKDGAFADSYSMARLKSE